MLSISKPYLENAKKLIQQIQKDYSFVFSEYLFNLKFKNISFNSSWILSGKIDAIFKDKNDNYLIVDWKTDRSDYYASEHRMQLEVYRKAFSNLKNIPLNKIKVAIGFIGLRPIININKIDSFLDLRQPNKTSFKTFEKYAKKLFDWSKNTDLFFKDLLLLKRKYDSDFLYNSIIETYLNKIKKQKSESKRQKL